MIESSFATINRVINEPSNSSDLLRIIAGELKGQDRQSVLLAAEELELAQRVLTATSLELIETRQRLIAVNERLIEERRAQRWSMSGSFKVVLNDR